MTRLATISIFIENKDSVVKVNGILMEYSDIIISRPSITCVFNFNIPLVMIPIVNTIYNLGTQDINEDYKIGVVKISNIIAFIFLI